MLLSKEEFEARIYEIIGRSIPPDISHFWVQLFEGTLPIDGVRHWAKQMYFLTQEFGRYTSAIHANCPIFAVRHVLAETLYEEHGRMMEKKDHPELFRRFARALGITDSELAAARPLPETEALLDWLLDLCLHGHFVESLAGFGVAVEGQASKGIPIFLDVFRTKHRLGEEALEFWTTHAADDVEHGRRSMELVLEHASTPALQTRALDAVRKSMGRLMLFQHGIGRWYGAEQFDTYGLVDAAVNA